MFNKQKKQNGITLIALIVSIIVLLILVVVSISFVLGDNGILSQTQYATIKTAKENFLKEVNMAYVDAYAEKIKIGSVNSEITMSDVYNKMSTELKGHVIVQDIDNSISLSNSSQISISLLSNEVAIGNDGLANHNKQNITLEVGEKNGTKYWGEVKGKYYPIILDNSNSKIVLDEKNSKNTQPQGTSKFGSEISINYKDNGFESETTTSKIVSIERDGTTLSIKALAVGTTKLVVKNGNTPLKEGEITVTVNPVYDVAITAEQGGTVEVTTNGVPTTVIGKYGKNVNILVTAIPDNEKVFDKWSDEVEEKSRNLAITSDFNLSANFKNKPVPISATDILANPSSYYGNKVAYSGYSGTRYKGEWKIFHATNTNIFLAACNGYSVALADKTSNYNGTSDFIAKSGKTIQNFPAVSDGWLYRIFDASTSTVKYTSSLNNMKVAEYLLDSIAIWNQEFGTDASRWVIGTPTNELFFNAWSTYKGKVYTCPSVADEGYNSTSDYNESVPGYFMRVAGSFWTAGPGRDQLNHNDDKLTYMYNLGNRWKIDRDTIRNNHTLLPIVCLKSGVRLERVSTDLPWELNTELMTN